MGETISSPLVSVGIPTYNRPDGLKKTLDRITQQTYQNLEIIVSDNCTEGDEVEKVVQEFIQNDVRIQFYKQEVNQGAVYNFKYVLEQAKGTYFMWASDDDSFEPAFITDAVKSFAEHPGIIFCTHYGKVFQEGKLSFSNQNLHTYDRGLTKLGRIEVTLAQTHTYNTGVYGLYSREHLNNVQLHNYFASDLLLLVELSQYGEFIQLPHHYFTYYPTENSMSSTHENYIKELKLKPYFIKNHMSIALTLYFSRASLSWKTLSSIEHIKVIKLIYLRFYPKSIVWDLIKLLFGTLMRPLSFLWQKK